MKLPQPKTGKSKPVPLEEKPRRKPEAHARANGNSDGEREGFALISIPELKKRIQ